MNIIVGHSNMDLDCFGSMVLARYIFPEYRLITSRLIHPVAKHLFNLYQNRLNALPSKELKGESVDTMIILDTRNYRRVKEYLEPLQTPPKHIEVYDHHQGAVCDIDGAVINEMAVGANTTQLALLCMERGITLEQDDATIALAGIYADTGNFTHENVTEEDFRVSTYLMEQGASVKLVKEFLKTLKEEHQVTLFHELLNRLSYHEIQGHFIIVSYLELEKQMGGLAAVVEKVFEVENGDAIFSVFHFEKEKDTLIIGRSQKPNINVMELFSHFDGGGHAAAASALIKNGKGDMVYKNLMSHLNTALLPAVTAEQIMTTNIHVLRENWTLLEASMFLEQIDHKGAPVLDDNDLLTGFMTLKDIMKGRKVNQMHAPVKGYMSRKVITGTPDMTMREVERLLYLKNTGHLPIIDNGKLLGIITRTDYLKFRHTHPVNRQEKTAAAAAGG